MTEKEMLSFGDFYAMQKNRDYSYQTIYDGEIFLSYPKTFNDPFDSMILVDKKEFEFAYLERECGEEIYLLACKLVKAEDKCVFEKLRLIKSGKIPLEKSEGFESLFALNFAKLKKQCDELFDAYFKELQKVRNRYGVACFTINKPNDNMAMWAHYAENYNGFCLKYNFGKVVGALSNQIYDKYAYHLLQHLHKVKYLKKFKQLDAKILLSLPLDKIYNSSYVNKYVRGTMDKKYYQWNYENEYRLILDKEDKFVTKTLENDNGFRIKFDYLKELYVSSDKLSLQKELVIKEIAKKFKVKYLLLTTNKGNVSLVEDERKINIHNIDIDLKKLGF